MAKKQNQQTQFGDDLMPTELEKDLKKYEGMKFTSLIKQIETEYQLSWYFMKPKLDEWALRLKLYNNQRRDKEAIGDPLMFTVHQTVLASLYTDKLNVAFEGREDGDNDTAGNLNALALYDHDDMEKDIADYEWDWDSSFFGRGLEIFMDFDRDTLTPIPEVVDMMTWLRDPRAKSVRGDRRGRGRMRFGGRDIRLTKGEMKDAGVYFGFQTLKSDSTDINSLVDRYSELRAEAQGLGNSKNIQLSGDNADFRVLEWFTSWKGKPVLVSLANDRKQIIRITTFKDNRFPILDRSIYPMAHDWDGVSIPDLTEDKQRARSALQNLGLKGIKAGLNPMYIYDTNRIKNRADLNFKFNKFIGVTGNPVNAILPMQKDQVKQEATWILDVLDTAAQKSTATPDMQQGMTSDTKRTATEMNAVQQNVGVRYSLSARIFGWSEKRFWQKWYGLYNENFDEKIDEKVIRIAGALNSSVRTLKRKDFISGGADPDIIIESKAVSDAQKVQMLNVFRLFVKDATTLDPSFNIRLAVRELGRLTAIPQALLNQLMPPNIDEMVAEQENAGLNKNKRQEVSANDDDQTHLIIHNKTKDTPYKIAHIEAHKRAMLLKKTNPELFPQQNSQVIPAGDQLQQPRQGLPPTAAPSAKPVMTLQ